MTITLAPVRDTYVSDKDTQTGTEDYLRTRSRNGGPENITSMIAFDVTNGVPSGANILNATLELYMYSTKKSSDVLDIHGVLLSWSEGGVTWSSYGWKSGAYDSAVEASTATGTAGWKSWDVTALVQSWVTGAMPDYGFYLLNDSAGGGHDDWYYSREYVTSNLRPYLEVTFVP